MAYYGARYDHSDHSIFLVGQDESGRHCVRESHGLIGGAFITRAEAIRFAQDESQSIPGSLVLVTPAMIATPLGAA